MTRDAIRRELDRPVTRDKVRLELDRLAEKVERALKKHEKGPKSESEEFLCPGVGSVGRCTNTAVYMADKLGGVVYGYSIDENPEAKVGEAEFGHDFAVVDDRWLVDFWAKDTYRLPDLYDFDDPAEKMEVRRLYGDPALWKRMSPENFEGFKRHIKGGG